MERGDGALALGLVEREPLGGAMLDQRVCHSALLGREIVLAEVLPPSDPVQRHAWNRLADGREYDLTRDQFPAGQQFRECAVPEALVLAVSGRQAELLLQRVQAALGEGLEAASQ